jgi:hypothetical protein
MPSLPSAGSPAGRKERLGVRDLPEAAGTEHVDVRRGGVLRLERVVAPRLAAARDLAPRPIGRCAGAEE